MQTWDEHRVKGGSQQRVKLKDDHDWGDDDSGEQCIDKKLFSFIMKTKGSKKGCINSSYVIFLLLTSSWGGGGCCICGAVYGEGEGLICSRGGNLMLIKPEECHRPTL